MPQALHRAPQDDTSRQDLLVIAVWFGLITGLVEGLLFFHVRHLRILDLTWVPVVVDLALALIVVLPLLALRKVLAGRPSLYLRATCLFGWLMFFDWLRVTSPVFEGALPPDWLAAISAHPLAETVAVMLIALLLAVIAGVLLARPRGRRLQRRTLPLVAALALLCVAGVPLLQRLHESRQIAHLPAPAPQSPNVLVIVVDTLRADHLSTYGYARPTSPNLDRIASQGVLFENAMAASSWTLPSHASMLTGRYPHEHRARFIDSTLTLRYPTLGEAFQRLGYRTAGFSASTYFFSRRTGLGRGFIHFEDDFESPAAAFPQTYYGERLEKALYTLHLAKDRIGRRNARQINQHALRWIASGHRPFFVFLNYYDVHDPYLPPDPYLHRFTSLPHPAGPIPLAWDWFAKLTPQQRQGEMDAYDGAIQYMDSELGDFFRQLHQRGLDQNTLVVITSDHGEEFNEHGFMDHLNALYRELIHVPLIFWEPGKLPAGVRLATPVSTVSLPATLLSLVPNGAARHMPGLSLASLWTDPGQPHDVMPVISELAQFKLTPLFPNYYGSLTSLTTPQWHYISGGKAGEELFRCCGNAPERDNLAATQEGQRVCQEFKRQLEFTAEKPQLAVSRCCSPTATQTR
jgi:arylsulfatase A-like enzyme